MDFDFYSYFIVGLILLYFFLAVILTGIIILYVQSKLRKGNLKKTYSFLKNIVYGSVGGLIIAAFIETKNGSYANLLSTVLIQMVLIFVFIFLGFFYLLFLNLFYNRLK